MSTTPQAAPRPWPEVDAALRARFAAVAKLADPHEHARQQQLLRREVEELWRTNRITDAQLRAVLVGTDAFRTRERWLAGEPLRLEAGLAWDSTPLWTIRARAVAGASGEFVLRPRGGLLMCGMAPIQAPRPAELGPLEAGADRVRFELHVERPSSIWPHLAGELDALEPPARDFVFELPVQAVERAEQALPRFDSAELDAALRAGCSLGFPMFRPGDPVERMAQLRIRLPEAALEEGTGVWLCVQAVRDAQSIESAWTFVERPAAGAWPADGWSGHVWLRSIPMSVEQDAAERARWQLRVSGRPEGALSLWRAQRWYAGSFEMPLEQVLRP